jgi:phosphoserine phosphatase
LATKVKPDLSGFISKNCYGQEKVNRLLEVEPDRKNYYLYAYGDSRGDREMLAFADFPTLVH